MTPNEHALPPPRPPSSWVQRFAPLIDPGGNILDLACGSGRYARYLAGLGFTVEAVIAIPR